MTTELRTGREAGASEILTGAIDLAGFDADKVVKVPGFALVEAINGGSGGGVTRATWLSLSSVTPEIGDNAIVLDSDDGTHTDPAVGGTVPNAGVYLGVAGIPPVWQRIGATQTSVVQGAAESAGVARDEAITAAANLATVADVSTYYEDAPVVITGPGGAGFFGCLNDDSAWSAGGGSPVSGARLDRALDDVGNAKSHLLYPHFIRKFPALMQRLQDGEDLLVELLIAPADSYSAAYGEMGLLARDLKAEASTRGRNGNGGFGWCGAGFGGALGAEPNGNVDQEEIRPIFIGTDWTGQYSIEQHSPDLCSATTNTAGNGIVWPYANEDTIATLDLHYIGTLNARYRWNEYFTVVVSSEAELLALRHVEDGYVFGTKVLRTDNVTVYSYSYAGLPETEGGPEASLADWTVLPWSEWTDVEAGTMTGAAVALTGIPEGSWSLHTDVAIAPAKIAGINGKRTRGIVVHNLGNNGSPLLVWAGYNAVPSAWRVSVAQAIVRISPNPAAWVVPISPNDQGQQFNYSIFEQALTLWHDDVARTIDIGMDILWVCPAENGRPIAEYPWRIAGYTAVVKNQAFLREFAVLDMQFLAGKDYSQYGHEGTHRRWFISDLLHPSVDYAATTRRKIFSALVHGS